MEQQHKRRTVLSGKWIWIAMLLSPAAWLIPGVVQRVPDPVAWKAFNSGLEEKLKRICGPDTGNAFALFGRTWQKQSTSATQVLAALPVDLIEGRAGVLPAASLVAVPLYRGAEEATSEALAQLSAAAIGGCVHPLQTMGTAGEIDSGFTGIHRASRLHANLGCMYATQGDWDNALRHLEVSARSGDALRMYGMDGAELAVAVRMRACKAYEQLLGLRPDATASRRIIASLERLAASEPRPDLHTLCAQYLKEIRWRYYDPGLPVTLQSDALSNMRQDGPFTWERSDNIAGFYRSSSADRPSFFPWTQLGATFVGIRRIVLREPALLAAHANAMEPLKDTDPLYRALCVYTCPAERVRRLASDSRLLATRRQLLEAALAARIHRERESAWPESLAQLPADVLATGSMSRAASAFERAEIPLGQTLANAGVAYGPFRCGMTSLTQDNLNAYLGFELEYSKPSHWGEVTNGKRKVVIELFFQAATPPLSVLLAHTIAETCKQRLGETVTSITVSMRRLEPVPGALRPGPQPMVPGMQTEPGGMPPEMGFTIGTQLSPTGPSSLFSVFYPVASGRAVQAAISESDTLRKLAALGGQPANVQDATLPEFKDAFIHLELDVPEKAFAVWSIGPDGLDDGGAIESLPDASHDFPNPRADRGDIVIFP